MWKVQNGDKLNCIGGGSVSRELDKKLLEKLPQTEMYDKIIYGFGVHFHLWFCIFVLRVDSTEDFFVIHLWQKS